MYAQFAKHLLMLQANFADNVVQSSNQLAQNATLNIQQEQSFVDNAEQSLTDKYKLE